MIPDAELDTIEARAKRPLREWVESPTLLAVTREDVPRLVAEVRKLRAVAEAAIIYFRDDLSTPLWKALFTAGYLHEP